jgi:hypothetical protein
MTPREFAYWLQGFFEIKGQLKGPIKESLTPEQVTMIRDHLQYVFQHMQAQPAAQQPQFVPSPLPGGAIDWTKIPPFEPITVIC